MGEGFDVGEGGDEGVGGFAEGEAAEAGGVDDEAAGGGADEVAESRAVAAFIVEVAGVHHVLDVGVGEVIHECAFADAGAAEDDAGDAGLQVVADVFHSFAGDDADGMNWGAGGDGRDLRDQRFLFFA